MPYWTTENNDIILKIKDNFVPILDMVAGVSYTLDLIFESYCIENEGLPAVRGYYAKVLNAKK